MGTNYMRIPKSKDIRDKHIKLMERVSDMDIWDVSNIDGGFRTIKDPNSEYDWDNYNPWDEFMDGMSVHLGKRSMGWKFCWNFHDGKYYTNKEELLKFIRSGRVVDEYGDLQDTEEFIEMALNWGKEEGLSVDEQYVINHGYSFTHIDKEIDGLRVSSSTEFS